MSGAVGYQEARLTTGGCRVALTLAAPARCNSLEPAILSGLAEALDRARQAGATFVTLQAEGRHFSTGGDVAAFDAALRAGKGEAYSDNVVGLSQDAFLQPYFAEVGFSPDGGWSALLPERIGAGRALQIQLANERIAAAGALDLRLAHRVVPAGEVANALEALVDRLAQDHVPSGMLAAKRLVWDEARLAAVDARLAAELASFKRQIAAPETAAGMGGFLEQPARSA